MRFLIDDQLPAMLAGEIARFGVVAEHVTAIGLGGADDGRIWAAVCTDDWIIVSKDRDFVHLQAAVAPARGRILWLRFGNMRKPALRAAMHAHLADCIERFRAGAMLVEMR